MLPLKVILHPLGKGSHYFGVGLLYKFPLNYKYTRGGWAGNPSPHLAFIYHTLAGEIPAKRLEGAKGLTAFWKGGPRGAVCNTGNASPEAANQSVPRAARASVGSPGGGATKEGQSMSWKKRGARRTPARTPHHGLIRTGSLGRRTADQTDSDRSRSLWVTFNDP